jgi:hypothetical protein
MHYLVYIRYLCNERTKLSCYHDNYFKYFMFEKCNGFVSKARVSACMYFLVYTWERQYLFHIREIQIKAFVQPSRLR